MEVVGSIDAFTDTLDAARQAGRTVGLVPTMGALHAGHRSLIVQAAAECDHVGVTIFVNPLQFAEPEDIDRYPRTLDADLDVCREAGASTVLTPSITEMYPDWPAPVATTVSVAGSPTGGRGLAPGPLRRRGHRRRQALRHGRSLPGLLRREGLPAAGAWCAGWPPTSPSR